MTAAQGWPSPLPPPSPSRRLPNSIEECFRAPKAGTRIEDRRLDDANDLRKCLAFDTVTAWRVFEFGRAARDHPERRATDVMYPDEVFMLYLELCRLRVIRAHAPPDSIPDLQTLAVGLGQYVGFIPSRLQPIPGAEKLWNGLEYLMIATTAYRALKEAGVIIASTVLVTGYVMAHNRCITSAVVTRRLRLESPSLPLAGMNPSR